MLLRMRRTGRLHVHAQAHTYSKHTYHTAQQEVNTHAGLAEGANTGSLSAAHTWTQV